MVPKRSSWLLLLDFIDRPGAALGNVVAYPRWRWLIPAALAVLGLAASTVLTAPLLAIQAEQMMAEVLRNMPADQVEAVQGQMAALQTPTFIILQTIGLGLLAMLIGWLVRVAVLYFGQLVAGGELEFNGVFVAMPWLNLPLVLERMLQTAYILYSGRLITNQGLSFLFSSGKAVEDARNPLYVALSQATLFQLWHLILVYILFRAVGKLGMGTSFLLTVLYFSLLLAGQLGLVALNRMLVPSL